MQARLEKVFSSFDSGGSVPTDVMRALGLAWKRKLAGRGQWTEASNESLLEKIGGSGSISRRDFIEAAQAALPKDAIVFEELTSAFIVLAYEEMERRAQENTRAGREKALAETKRHQARAAWLSAIFGTVGKLCDAEGASHVDAAELLLLGPTLEDTGCSEC